jgi:hypothetical protein
MATSCDIAPVPSNNHCVSIASTSKALGYLPQVHIDSTSAFKSSEGTESMGNAVTKVEEKMEH